MLILIVALLNSAIYIPKLTEIKTICSCGSKAVVNARVGEDGYVVTEGSQVLLGGNDCYVAMCHKCWKNAIKNHLKVEKI